MDSRKRDILYMVGDFETTVYDGQTSTEVWASAIVPMYTEDVIIFHSIQETYDYLKHLNRNIVLYYHNLKFDGSFWIDFLIRTLNMKQAYSYLDDEGINVEWMSESAMPSNSFRYTVSTMGQWYTLIIKTETKTIELRDSLKLLPFSVRELGKSFGTKHKKLDMEYTGYRYAGCEITPEEKEYIANDVLVVKEALEIMFKEGHSKLTIGACCLAEFKKTYDKKEYEAFFPNLYDIPIDPADHGCENAGEWIRKSYRGGWCYLVKGKERKKYHDGTTADVNSLYPSMMSSESGNVYPVMKPHFWTGNFIPEEATYPKRFFFVRVRTRFYVKKNYLPFVQIKNSALYVGNECLESSDVLYEGQYYKFLRAEDGTLIPTSVAITMTMTDYYLFLEHYNVEDFEILDGCWFYGEIGLFDEYIEKYKKIKLESKGALRTLAKLFLNNLYGKMASSKDSSFKVAYERDDGGLSFRPVHEMKKKPGYIAIGSAITSYARNFTIRAAQKNYHGVHSSGFIYADTDSIHCDLPPEDIVGIKVHDKNFCCWKLESCWDEAFFVRQKTYAEHIVAEDLEPIEKPYWNVKCAGMPQHCKDLFVHSLTGEPFEEEKYTEEEKEFMRCKREIEDFNYGLIVPGKLLPKRIEGGILLVPTDYEMRE